VRKRGSAKRSSPAADWTRWAQVREPAPEKKASGMRRCNQTMEVESTEDLPLAASRNKAANGSALRPWAQVNRPFLAIRPGSRVRSELPGNGFLHTRLTTKEPMSSAYQGKKPKTLMVERTAQIA